MKTDMNIDINTAQSHVIQSDLFWVMTMLNSLIAITMTKLQVCNSSRSVERRGGGGGAKRGEGRQEGPNLL